MNLTLEPGCAAGVVTAPPSKSLAHRVLICSALSGQPCIVENMAWSDDLLATLDCLTALGARVEKLADRKHNQVTIDGSGILTGSGPVRLPCRASGSTLRFLLP
ncbi:MAG: 3-phosphoshikimate 1-carboxyvinyltransferase, partial [Oscillospiraceae bacterium]|nr:3-phosphoshikimate 1-carboxyvinyltransferase [Oscillospiraceae bacterium]